MTAIRATDFRALPGWERDDHAAARAAFFVTADLLGADWAEAVADRQGPDRGFFERHFTPVEIGMPPALLTGYYEPELPAAPFPTDRFTVPLLALPPDLGPIGPTRAAITGLGLFHDHAIAWVEDPLEAFLAQVQGSVRLRLIEGGVLRLGFAGRNGHGYRSIGQELIRRGEIAPAAISAGTIRAWCAAHPGQVFDLLAENPSYVFFRILDLAADSGPLGAMGRPVSPGRSLAVDPDQIPLGAPVWVAGAGLDRLCTAQDTGSAIRGAQRGDLFCGWGQAAGEQAGAMKDAAHLVTLLPHRLAQRLLAEQPQGGRGQGARDLAARAAGHLARLAIRRPPAPVIGADCATPDRGAPDLAAPDRTRPASPAPRRRRAKAPPS